MNQTVKSSQDNKPVTIPFIPVPKHLKLVRRKMTRTALLLQDHLFDILKSNKWSNGMGLFFVSELCEELNVSDNSIRSALAECEKENIFLIYNMGSKGKFIMIFNDENRNIYESLKNGSLHLKVDRYLKLTFSNQVGLKSKTLFNTKFKIKGLTENNLGTALNKLSTDPKKISVDSEAGFGIHEVKTIENTDILENPIEINKEINYKNQTKTKEEKRSDQLADQVNEKVLNFPDQKNNGLGGGFKNLENGEEKHEQYQGPKIISEPEPEREFIQELSKPEYQQGNQYTQQELYLIEDLEDPNTFGLLPSKSKELLKVYGYQRLNFETRLILSELEGDNNINSPSGCLIYRLKKEQATSTPSNQNTVVKKQENNNFKELFSLARNLKWVANATADYQKKDYISRMVLQRFAGGYNQETKEVLPSFKEILKQFKSVIDLRYFQEIIQEFCRDNSTCDYCQDGVVSNLFEYMREL